MRDEGRIASVDHRFPPTTTPVTPTAAILQTNHKTAHVSLLLRKILTMGSEGELIYPLFNKFGYFSNHKSKCQSCSNLS